MEKPQASNQQSPACAGRSVIVCITQTGSSYDQGVSTSPIPYIPQNAFTSFKRSFNQNPHPPARVQPFGCESPQDLIQTNEGELAFVLTSSIAPSDFL